jgi:hypothetical protein
LTVADVAFGLKEGTNMTVHGLVKQLRTRRSGQTVGFAVKVIGIGLFAGLTMTYCQYLIDACFKGLR